MSSGSIAIFCNAASYLRGTSGRLEEENGCWEHSSPSITWTVISVRPFTSPGPRERMLSLYLEAVRLDLLSPMAYWFAPSICLKFVLLVALPLPACMKVHPKHPSPSTPQSLLNIPGILFTYRPQSREHLLYLLSVPATLVSSVSLMFTVVWMETNK